MSAFSILVGLGASLAILWVVLSVPRWQSSRWANAGLLVLLGALTGARIFYVAASWGFFNANLLEIFAVWNGGIYWPGAVLGGAISMLLIAYRWGISIAKFADVLSPMIPPLVISAWLAGWMSGHAYGVPAPEGAFWGVPALDEFGNSISRFPLQILAAISMLVYAFFLEMRKAGFHREGQKMAWMLFGLSLNVLIFIPLRADPVPALLGKPLDLWAAITLFLISVGLLVWMSAGIKEKEPV